MTFNVGLATELYVAAYNYEDITLPGNVYNLVYY